MTKKPLSLRQTLHRAMASAALTPLTAVAQSSPAEQTLPIVKAQDDTAAEPAVTQIGKTPQLLRDIPQTVTVIDRTVLDAQGATSLTDALRNVPGITLSAGEGGVIGDNVNLRGYSARTDLYVDGLRDRGQYSRETAFLESIEVLKGPASMLFGRGSTGGVINQVTKQPQRGEFIEVGASVGTDSYYRLTADVNQPISATAAFRVAAVGHSSESTRDVVESDRYGIVPSLRFGIGQPTEIAVSAILQRRDDIPDYGFPLDGGSPIDANRNNFYGFTDDRFAQDVGSLSLRIAHEFSAQITLRNQTQYGSVRVEAKPTTITSAGVRNRRERDIDDATLYNQTDLVLRFGTDTLAHTLILGVELGRDDYENQGYDVIGETTETDMAHPTYAPLPASATRSPTTFADNVAKTMSVYANEQLDLGTYWKLVAGARWDLFDFETTVTDDTSAVTVAANHTDRMISTRAGIVHQPNEIQTYYASYGTSFNPSAENLTVSTANMSVEPEKSRSYEIGAKWSLAEGALLLTSAAFRVDKYNARTSDPVLGVTLDGETRVDGFEFGISGPITKQWSVLAGYTYLDGEILRLTEAGNNPGMRDGNTLPNTPKHNVSLWSTYDLAHGWQLGAGLVYAGERILNNANTTSVEGYTRIDATVAYLAKQYTVRVNLQNVTDEEYFEVASAGRATPAAARAALATLTWKF